MMNGTDTPKVSVCIPAFNAAEYLRQAVESALKQSYQNFEIVIVDNCSTDQTALIVAKVIQENPGRIFYFRNNQNIGLVGNLNKCVEHASGAYIKFLCADDLLLPGCLEQMVTGLDVNPTVTLVTCGRQLIDAKGNKLGIRKYRSEDCVVAGAEVITRCLFGGNYIGEPSAALFRKHDVTGSFREDLPQLSDMDMWFQLLERGDLLSLERPLCAFRSHAAQMTHANVKLGMIVEDNIKLFETYSQKPYLEATWFLKMQHKLLMTYRIWLSRKSISDEKREIALGKYASQLAYWLMPIVGMVLYLRARIIGTK